MKKSCLVAIFLIFSFKATATEMLGSHLFLGPSSATFESSWLSAKFCISEEMNLEFYYFLDSKNIYIEEGDGLYPFLIDEDGRNVFMGWSADTILSISEGATPNLKILEALAERLKNGMYVMASGMASGRSSWDLVQGIFIDDGTVENLNQLDLNDLWDQISKDDISAIVQLSGTTIEVSSVSNNEITLKLTQPNSEVHNLMARCR